MADAVQRTPRIPIFRLKDEYYIYSSTSLCQLRARHNIPGILGGTLPQAAQQNVFLGLPARLMTEEARLLVERGVAFVVEDARAHSDVVRWLDSADGKLARDAWFAHLAQMRHEAQRGRENVALSRREKALRRMGSEERRRVEGSVRGSVRADSPVPEVSEALFDDGTAHGVATAPDPSTAAAKKAHTAKCALDLPVITPSTSEPPLMYDVHRNGEALMPSETSAYALYKHLHELPIGYFLSPGLRFGCQFMVYPGDPLRFHSHFLAAAKEWEEEFDLLQLVGGGRLGTGVKKGFLVGGEIENGETAGRVAAEGKKDIRCFCIEWAGM